MNAPNNLELFAGFIARLGKRRDLAWTLPFEGCEDMIKLRDTGYSLPRCPSLRDRLSHGAIGQLTLGLQLMSQFTNFIQLFNILLQVYVESVR